MQKCLCTRRIVHEFDRNAGEGTAKETLLEFHRRGRIRPNIREIVGQSDQAVAILLAQLTSLAPSLVQGLRRLRLRFDGQFPAPLQFGADQAILGFDGVVLSAWPLRLVARCDCEASCAAETSERAEATDWIITGIPMPSSWSRG